MIFEPKVGTLHRKREVAHEKMSICGRWNNVLGIFNKQRRPMVLPGCIGVLFFFFYFYDMNYMFAKSSNAFPSTR